MSNRFLLPDGSYYASHPFRQTQAEHLRVIQLCRWIPTGGHAGSDVALVKIVHNDVQCHKESCEIEVLWPVSFG